MDVLKLFLSGDLHDREGGGYGYSTTVYLRSVFPGHVLVIEMTLNDKILHVFSKNMSYSFMALLRSYLACLLIDL